MTWATSNNADRSKSNGDPQVERDAFPENEVCDLWSQMTNLGPSYSTLPNTVRVSQLSTRELQVISGAHDRLKSRKSSAQGFCGAFAP